ncbi:hypothetical protein F4694_003311 [Bacillus niacini]|jgi:hypothetical protein|uniref:Uncharacterized protein n=1 Tax=Neobacillus niacini TaxID=86668 RepID=A0A852TEA2_9BACI|nr:hypothetical protein [Neobacillus niacini]NYE06531.1 hypothetical protein [Neobacillus niacini]
MKQNIKAILAPMSPKERIAYIWDYYKFHIIGTIVAIILLLSLISSIGEKKEVVLNMTIIGQGVNPEGVVQLQEQLTNKLVQDKGDEEVSVQHLTYNKTSMDEASRAGIQKMSAEISLGAIDVMIVEKELFEEISSQNALLALNEFKGANKLLPSDEKVYGISTSDIQLLAPLALDENEMLCVPSTTKNLKKINEFFTFISK